MYETSQYLTFTLGEEVFALDIGTVREVLELTAITRIPRTPEFMRGVINLRGRAVPVLELRRKFGMDPVADTVNTCIIIVEAELEGEAAVIGALVDSVREVIEIPADAVEPAPRMGTAVRQDFIRGMGHRNDGFVIILDGNRIFSVEELAASGVAVGGTLPGEDAMPAAVASGDGAAM
ncbi:chemotaxis protein CheW [Nitratidesulfovibrio sp. HK-II]|jgi:purine-binding chemotaxis protein CheW|uniref:chemotaxis protein CheW n=1 Tax=Nitratidesulfovibrio sp. HK-II TaxID=2009266 RepID=UPI0002275BC6|nr:chemotaxis protein CheW [Nitratidesulfovibrio sp. HK-II]EGY26388.1 cheW-like domain protein [Desulfovibrio sp. A2]GBO95143.1 positive regulator of CheA protein activity CheW [Nitratidesulfovibrio sp. HK-II]HCG05029.1 chemotaxis protein CheW [Desulfovibrio sp.]